MPPWMDRAPRMRAAFPRAKGAAADLTQELHGEVRTCHDRQDASVRPPSRPLGLASPGSPVWVHSAGGLKVGVRAPSTSGRTVQGGGDGLQCHTECGWWVAHQPIHILAAQSRYGVEEWERRMMVIL